MNEKWNTRALAAPPVFSVKMELDDTKSDIITKVETIARHLVKILSHRTTLENEQFYLARVIYKLNNQKRREKAFCYLRLILKCLNRYLEMNLLRMMEALVTEFERSKEGDGSQTYTYVPSMQTLQYHLVRLQGGAGLLAQMAIYCTQAYVPMKQQTAQGHFLDKNLLFFGFIARLWVLSRYLVSCIVRTYNKLYSLVTEFPASQIPWLPEDQSIPPDLSVWINVNWPSLKPSNPRDTSNSWDIALQSLKADEPSTPNRFAFGQDEDIGVPLEDLETDTPILKKKRKILDIKIDFDGIKKVFQKTKTYKGVLKACVKILIPAVNLWKKKWSFPWRKQIRQLQSEAREKKTKFRMLKSKFVDLVNFIEKESVTGKTIVKLNNLLRIVNHHIRTKACENTAIRVVRKDQKLLLGPFTLHLNKRLSKSFLTTYKALDSFQAAVVKVFELVCKTTPKKKSEKSSVLKRCENSTLGQKKGGTGKRKKSKTSHVHNSEGALKGTDKNLHKKKKKRKITTKKRKTIKTKKIKKHTL